MTPQATRSRAAGAWAGGGWMMRPKLGSRYKLPGKGRSRKCHDPCFSKGAGDFIGRGLIFLA